MDPNKVIRVLEKVFFWGSVVLLVFFLFEVHINHHFRGLLAKEEYYRLGDYETPVAYPTFPPYVPKEKAQKEADLQAAEAEVDSLTGEVSP